MKNQIKLLALLSFSSLICANNAIAAITLSFQPPVVFQSDLNPQMIKIADVNNDSWADIITESSANNTVNVFINTTTGDFNPKVAYSTSAFPISIDFGDVNKDGKLDLVAGCNKKVSVLMGLGSGTFGSFRAFGSVPGGVKAVFGDMNRDGKLDIVYKGGFTSTTEVHYLAGNGTGGFLNDTQLEITSVGDDNLALALGEVNNDGKLDVVSGDRVFLGNGLGAITPGPLLSNGSGVPRSSQLGDFNRDGNLDYVAAMGSYIQSGLGGDNIAVTLSKSAGNRFFSPVIYPKTGKKPNSVAVGDLNRDGVSDVVFGTPQGVVGVMKGVPNGTFLPEIEFDGSGAIGSIDIGDLNRDGKQDIVVSNPFNHTISILYNSGS